MRPAKVETMARLWRCHGNRHAAKGPRPTFTEWQLSAPQGDLRNRKGPDMIVNSAILTYAGFAVAYQIAFGIGLI